jgi:hypothetical protein
VSRAASDSVERQRVEDWFQIYLGLTAFHGLLMCVGPSSRRRLSIADRRPAYRQSVVLYQCQYFGDTLIQL